MTESQNLLENQKNGKIIVLFEVEIKDGKKEDYLNRATTLKEYLKNMKGFISAERFQSLANEKKLLSMTIWESEESIKIWRNMQEHRNSQMAGRMEDFEDYKITVVTPIREYGMNDRKNAPTDSNEYFKV